MTCSAVRHVDVAAGIEEARAHVRGVLAQADLDVTGEAGDHFDVRTPMRWRGVGSAVTIDLAPIGLGTRVTVHARSLLRATVYDFGAARQAATGIARALEAPDGPRPAERGVMSGLCVADPRLRWFGLVLCALAAVLAAFVADRSERTVLLVAAVVGAVLWAGAVVSGAVRIRRVGQIPPTWQPPVVTGISLGIAFMTSGELVPNSAALLARSSAMMSSMAAAIAITGMVFRLVRLLRR